MTDPKEEPETCPPGGMTTNQYRVRAKEMVDYIADYLDNIRSRRVYPDVKPGYMQQLIPDTAPNRPEPWSQVLADVERVIMPGITHFQSPYMHANVPALNSYPSLIADMLTSAINTLAFSWASSPACTELETIVMDLLGKMIGLPPMFLHADKKSKGGGCMQTTASDCTFMTLMAARANAIQRYKASQPDRDDSEVNGRLIGYCSDQSWQIIDAMATEILAELLSKRLESILEKEGGEKEGGQMGKTEASGAANGLHQPLSEVKKPALDTMVKTHKDDNNDDGDDDSGEGAEREDK